jgi:hypothetical protein
VCRQASLNTRYRRRGPPGAAGWRWQAFGGQLRRKRVERQRPVCFEAGEDRCQRLRVAAPSLFTPCGPRRYPPLFQPDRGSRRVSATRLATANALRVRSPIMPALSSATFAICCNRNRPVAPSMVGRSTKRISTSAARSFDRKATLRVSLETLATTSAARCARHSYNAASQLRPLVAAARLDFNELLDGCQWPPLR